MKTRYQRQGAEGSAEENPDDEPWTGAAEPRDTMVPERDVSQRRGEKESGHEERRRLTGKALESDHQSKPCKVTPPFTGDEANRKRQHCGEDRDREQDG